MALRGEVYLSKEGSWLYHSFRVYLHDSTDTQWPKRGVFLEACQDFSVRFYTIQVAFVPFA